MATIYDLEPKRVFHHFAELCKIPHGSGNLQTISDHLVNFAKAHGLKYTQDEALNVIIEKDATPGYENEPGIILQGHMDMVAVHKPELDIDMTKDPLKPMVDGDYLYAEGTSLGGDDGIAVAYALAILEDDTLPHPHLDVVITTNEETGMDGAVAIDISSLKGTRLFNLDSEDEGVFLVGCAGGARVDHIFHVNKEEKTGYGLSVLITGLQGGHSGAEIHKERGNANVLMGRLLCELREVAPIYIYDLDGGLADNAIPRECRVSFLTDGDVAAFESVIADFEKTVKIELATKDPGFAVKVSRVPEQTASVMDQEALQHMCDALIALPNGVQAMSADVPGLVQTSLNNGILRLEENRVYLVTSVRSSIGSEKDTLIRKICTITKLCGGKNNIRGEYPGWAYRTDSPFRDLCLQVYRDMYHKEPKVEAIHAGVECGLLIEKRPDLDAVSIGPDMKDIHTTEEKLGISSAGRVYEYVCKVLAQKVNG